MFMKSIRGFHYVILCTMMTVEGVVLALKHPVCFNTAISRIFQL